jgi:hypothetical protein
MAQTRTFTSDSLEYVLELPSPSWQAVSRLDVHEHLEFIYDGDQTNGYLRLRKKLVAAGTTGAALFQEQEKWELQGLPGYVACSNGRGAQFSGYLRGTVFAYEYVSNGRNMDGRIYYFQVDTRTFYLLHFTVRSDRLADLSAQMDSIARSFRWK